MKHQPGQPPASLKIAAAVLAVIILIWAIGFSLLAIQQHRTFQTHGLDLGNVDQALWNTAQGRFLQFSLMTPVSSRLALHVEPVLLLFVPLYGLGLGSPELLLVTQATVVAWGAWPVYRYAGLIFQPLTGPRWQPYLLLSFPVAYLLLPTLQSAVLFDFHAVTLAPTFILMAWLSLARHQQKSFWLFVLLAMACKEDMPLVMAMTGLYIGLSHRQWRRVWFSLDHSERPAGAKSPPSDNRIDDSSRRYRPFRMTSSMEPRRLAGQLIALSLLWFIIAFFIIQPHFAAGGNIQLDRYAWLGDSPGQMVQTAISQPNLVIEQMWITANLPGYLGRLLLPTAFLGLLSPLALLPMLPSLAINLLSDNPFTWRLEDFHYGAPLAPFILIAAIQGSYRLGEVGQRVGIASKIILPLIAGLLLSCSLGYHYYRGYTPLARPFDWPPITPHHQRLADLLTTLPPTAPVFSQSNLAPHLSHRPFIYSDFAYFTDPAFPAPQPVEIVVLDITSFENFGGLHQFLQQKLSTGPYHRLTARDGLLYFRRTTTPRPTEAPLPAEFYTFSQPTSPPAYHLPADFGDLIRLHGHTLHFNRQEEAQLSLDLEPLAPLTEVWPVLYLLDRAGQPVGATTDLQPTLVWYPPAAWPVGEMVRLRFNTLPWHTRQTPAYGLAVGFIQSDHPPGEAVWSMAHRLPPIIRQATDLAPRLAAEGTLLEVAHLEQVWDIPTGGPVARRYDQPQPAHPLTANFNDQLQLLGYDNLSLTNDQVTIQLYWQTLSPIDRRLVRFGQFIGPTGQLHGQQDSWPLNGRYPVDLWQPGEIVVETVAFPLNPDRPAGPATLHVGFYDPATGARLPLVQGADHVEIPLEH